MMTFGTNRTLTLATAICVYVRLDGTRNHRNRLSSINCRTEGLMPNTSRRVKPLPEATLARVGGGRNAAAGETRCARADFVRCMPSRAKIARTSR